VKDIEAARRLYGESLGLEQLYSFGTLAFFNCGGIRLMLAEGEGAPAESIIYFRVADISGAHATLSGRGVEFVSAPHVVHRHTDGTEEWMAFFKDNEGRGNILLRIDHIGGPVMRLGCMYRLADICNLAAICAHIGQPTRLHPGGATLRSYLCYFCNVLPTS
jgi:catechol 2,3-dioxygenase-like lactoylglutathione lyase family enzyme